MADDESEYLSIYLIRYVPRLCYVKRACKLERDFAEKKNMFLRIGSGFCLTKLQFILLKYSGYYFKRYWQTIEKAENTNSPVARNEKQTLSCKRSCSSDYWTSTSAFICTFSLLVDNRGKNATINFICDKIFYNYCLKHFFVFLIDSEELKG